MPGYDYGYTPNVAPTFDTMGAVNVGSQVVSAAASLVAAGISYRHTLKMDAINYRIQQDAYEFQKQSDFETRQFNARIYAMNADKLRESLASESLVFQIQEKKDRAQAEAQLTAANISNTEGIVNSMLKSKIRDEGTLRTNAANQLAAQKSKAYMQQVPSAVLYEPQKTGNQAAKVQLGLNVQTVGTQLFSKYKPDKMPS